MVPSRQSDFSADYALAKHGIATGRGSAKAHFQSDIAFNENDTSLIQRDVSLPDEG
jgi:hypothetical protein